MLIILIKVRAKNPRKSWGGLPFRVLFQRIFFYFDKVLSFGLRSAAYFMQRVSNSIKFICKLLSILIENYLDDLAGADTPDKAWHSFEELGNVLQFSGLKESVDKASPPSTQMVFIGVLFDSVSLTLSITPERLIEIRSLVSQWLLKREATLRELQSLIGKLNFVAHCVKPARIFISRLLNWLRQIKNTDSSQVIPLETKKRSYLVVSLFTQIQRCVNDGFRRVEQT